MKKLLDILALEYLFYTAGATLLNILKDFISRIGTTYATSSNKSI